MPVFLYARICLWYWLFGPDYDWGRSCWCFRQLALLLQLPLALDGSSWPCGSLTMCTIDCDFCPSLIEPEVSRYHHLLSAIWCQQTFVCGLTVSWIWPVSEEVRMKALPCQRNSNVCLVAISKTSPLGLSLSYRTVSSPETGCWRPLLSEQPDIVSHKMLLSAGIFLLTACCQLDSVAQWTHCSPSV